MKNYLACEVRIPSGALFYSLNKKRDVDFSTSLFSMPATGIEPVREVSPAGF